MNVESIAQLAWNDNIIHVCKGTPRSTLLVMYFQEFGYSMQVNTAVELCAGHKIPTVENKVTDRDGKTHTSRNSHFNSKFSGC